MRNAKIELSAMFSRYFGPPAKLTLASLQATSFPGLFSAEEKAGGKWPWHRLITPKKCGCDKFLVAFLIDKVVLWLWGPWLLHWGKMPWLCWSGFEFSSPLIKCYYYTQLFQMFENHVISWCRGLFPPVFSAENPWERGRFARSCLIRMTVKLAYWWEGVGMWGVCEEETIITK